VADGEWQAPSVLLTVDLAILTLRDSSLHVLLVKRGVEPHAGMMALPGGFLRDQHEPIVAAARRELLEEAGLDADALHLEQFGVYGDPGRDPRGRVVSVAFLAIAPRLPDPDAGTDAADACWAPVDDVLSLVGRNLSWQIDVIQEAAAAGGWLTRDRVIQISGDENPSLRKFVRPVNAVVSELIAEGIAVAGVRRPLCYVRKKGKGICYEIPLEFIEFLTLKRSAEMA
jgi:ADP-ribose pyrophosphatase YjhB (NUDIX family)